MAPNTKKACIGNEIAEGNFKGVSIKIKYTNTSEIKQRKTSNNKTIPLGKYF